MNRLTNHQREFLQYIVGVHRCVGHRGIIEHVLDKGYYTEVEKRSLKKVVKKFTALVNEMRGWKPVDNEWCVIAVFNKPIKYFIGYDTNR